MVSGLLLEIIMQVIGTLDNWVPEAVHWSEIRALYWLVFTFAPLDSVGLHEVCLDSIYDYIPILSGASYIQTQVRICGWGLLFCNRKLHSRLVGVRNLLHEVLDVITEHVQHVHKSFHSVQQKNWENWYWGYGAFHLLPAVQCAIDMLGCFVDMYTKYAVFLFVVLDVVLQGQKFRSLRDAYKILWYCNSTDISWNWLSM